MTATETICATIATCWVQLMGVIIYAIRKFKGVSVKKNIEVDVK